MQEWQHAISECCSTTFFWCGSLKLNSSFHQTAFKTTSRDSKRDLLQDTHACFNFTLKQGCVPIGSRHKPLSLCLLLGSFSTESSLYLVASKNMVTQCRQTEERLSESRWNGLCVCFVSCSGDYCWNWKADAQWISLCPNLRQGVVIHFHFGKPRALIQHKHRVTFISGLVLWYLKKKIFIL